MATGGSGDVLAGLTAALTARISDETKAAATAVYLHGIAGDLAAKKYGMDGMTAVDIMECLRNP
jgi:NAD(P)H-hydrate epimerase